MKKLCMILPLAMILCFMVGCQEKEAMAELEEFKAQATIEEQNKEVVKLYIDTINKGAFDNLDEILSPDYAIFTPSRSTKARSRENLIESYKNRYHKAFPDINWSIEELYAERDRVILRFIVTATHEGEFRGIPATGNKIESSGMIIFRVENKMIVEKREDFDWLGMMQQLSMELKPKEEEKQAKRFE